VGSIELTLGLVDQKSANLADVDERRALELDALAPERASRELFAQDDRGARNDGGADAEKASVAVVDGQCDHDNIRGCESGGVEERETTAVVAALTDDGWFREACCTARVYVQDDVLYLRNISDYIRDTRY
jgi:hypothetical protein